jgi:hypothetical protein
MRFGELQICQTQDKDLAEMTDFINVDILKRDPVDYIEMRKGNDRRDFQRGNRGGRGGYNRDGHEGGFNKNRHQRRDEEPASWLKEDNEEKIKLKQQAQLMKSKLNVDKKEDQKIRLILNVISPDNYEKKFGEIRGYLFGDFKTTEECAA